MLKNKQLKNLKRKLDSVLNGYDSMTENEYWDNLVSRLNKIEMMQFEDYLLQKPNRAVQSKRHFF